MNCRFLAALGMTAVAACHRPAMHARDAIPGTLVEFNMVRVPAANGVRAFMIGRTELPWEAYDAFMMSPAPAATQGADAVARPSRPYGAPDYGWGHQGFPTISVAREAAEAFCAWLSAQTGKKYRLPTEAEWAHAARLARGAAPIDSLAWHAGNSNGRTHRAASRAADALGLYDLFGNAAEWVTTSDGQRVTRGGSFRDAPSAVGPNARAVQNDDWNERDPQIPKSRWWLSDGPFVGFRIVRELP
jgi:formylglycine-generating enzyme required for sulfatase activity